MVIPAPISHFYKYTSARTAEIVLSNCSVRYSKPNVLNDPNDCQLALSWDFQVDEVDAAFARRFVQVINSPEAPNYREFDELTLALEILRQNRNNLLVSDDELYKDILPLTRQARHHLD